LKQEVKGLESSMIMIKTTANPVRISLESLEDTILEKQMVNGKLMNVVQNPASEEEILSKHREIVQKIQDNNGYLRVALVENHNFVYHDLDLVYLVDIPKPNDLSELVFQFNGRRNTTITQIKKPGKILKFIHISMGKDVSTKGKAW
jgi:hypothetical protein